MLESNYPETEHYENRACAYKIAGNSWFLIPSLSFESSDGFNGKGHCSMGNKLYCFSFSRVSTLRILDDLAAYEARKERWKSVECEKLKIYNAPLVC